MNSLDEISGQYDEYLNWNYKKSQEDPEEEPYKSKYVARAILSELKITLNPQLLLETNDLEVYFKSLDDKTQKIYNKNAKSFLIEKLIDLNLAKNYLETEEYDVGERLLALNLKQLEDLLTEDDDKTFSIKKYNPLLYTLILNVLNELVFVWSRRSDYDKCLRLLTRAKEIYDFYANGKIEIEPCQLNEIIKVDLTMTNEKRKVLFESLYTHCNFYLAQIYGKMNDKAKSAYYCQITLQRQLDFSNTNDNIIDDSTENFNEEKAISFDIIEWATHCAALSQYYLTENEFSTSRHCLCCSEALLDYLMDKRTNLNESTVSRLDEQYARMNRCLAKYGIELLRYSKEKLCDNTKTQQDLIAGLDKPAVFRFDLSQTSFNLGKFEKSAISSNIALDYDQAKKIFHKTLEILQKTQLYFKLDGFVTEHCEILRDMCELYTHIMFFDGNLENKSKFLKRKLDLIKPVADELNEKYYLVLKRQLLFDIAEIYSDMMDNKCDIFNTKRESSDKTAISSMIIKINQLTKFSIQYFNLFLNTMKALPDKDKLPEKYDNDNVRPALLAHFYIGRLYSKFMTADPSERLKNTKLTLEYYSYLVNYCEKYQNDVSDEFRVMEVMKPEYNLCKEMIAFMPVKMENLRKNIK